MCEENYVRGVDYDSCLARLSFRSTLNGCVLFIDILIQNPEENG